MKTGSNLLEVAEELTVTRWKRSEDLREVYQELNAKQSAKAIHLAMLIISMKVELEKNAGSILKLLVPPTQQLLPQMFAIQERWMSLFQ
jgi:hypothetical protein